MAFFRALPLPFSVFVALALGTPQALAEARPAEPFASSAPMAAESAVRLAQKADKDDDKDDRKRKGQRPRDNDGKGAGGPPSKDRDAARKAADRKPQQKKEQAKPDVSKSKEAEAARAKAVKEKQLQLQQARDKALKQKQDAAAREKAVKQKQLEQAREKALKQNRDAAAARENAAKLQQLQQAREKALKQKQEAEAREKAAKQKQLEAQQAREKALKQKQLDTAREKSREQEFKAQQAREKELRQKQDAARKDRDTRKPAKFDRAKSDQEFERARREAQQKGGSGATEKWREDSVRKFESVRKGRQTREVGSRDIITEPDRRVIVRDEKRAIIRHDETARLAKTKKSREVRRERRKDGTWMVVTAGLAGALVYSLMDDDGRVLRRSRKGRDGREHVLFDDRRYYRRGGYGADYRPVYIDLPPPVVRIPRERYIVDYERASYEDIYEALEAPPIEDLDRGYSLDEVRYNYSILERMRRVDLDAITFAFASWEVGEDQYPQLERIARAMHRILERSPEELFLIEGHTDAVGDEIDNLSLSDRRAESVAVILTDVFDIPAENLATQGYGESHLKELTDGPSRINRRVAVRRITPLLAREGWDDPS